MRPVESQPELFVVLVISLNIEHFDLWDAFAGHSLMDKRVAASNVVECLVY